MSTDVPIPKRTELPRAAAFCRLAWIVHPVVASAGNTPAATAHSLSLSSALLKTPSSATRW